MGANCGSVEGPDDCGEHRTVASCGTCADTRVCGAQAPNVCGQGLCAPEEDLKFCARLERNCGSVSGLDNCGQPRTAASCGTCVDGQLCGALTPNVCGPHGYSIGGTVAGISSPLVLQNNGGDNLTVASNGVFVFSGRLPQKSTYTVTVFEPPSGQACVLENATGTVEEDVANIAVTCASNVTPEPLWSFTPSPDGIYENRVPVSATAGEGLPISRSVGGDPRTAGVPHQNGPLWLGQRQDWSINWTAQKEGVWGNLSNTTYHVHPELPQLAAGEAHALLIDPNMTLWAWGFGGNGQLGQSNNKPRCAQQPLKVTDDVRAVWAGGDNSMYLDERGRLWVMGSGSWLLETGEVRVLTAPTQVPLPDNVLVQTAAMSHSASVFALDSDNNLWGWGNNYGNALGIGAQSQQIKPGVVLQNVTLVAAGSRHALAVKTDGSLWVAGDNDSLGGECNRLGTKDNEDAPEWTRINSTSTWNDIFAIGAAASHNWFLTERGDLWMWGCNTKANIPGVESSVKRLDSPTKVMSEVVAVAAGNDCTLVMTENGKLSAYGNRSFACTKLVGAFETAGMRSLHASYFALALTGGFHPGADNPERTLHGWGLNDECQLGPSQQPK